MSKDHLSPIISKALVRGQFDLFVFKMIVLCIASNAKLIFFVKELI